MHVSGSYRRTSAGVACGPYWKLRQSFWEDGRTKKQNVVYLGAAPDRRAAYLLARQKGLLCGAHGCYQPPKTRLLEDGHALALCADHLHERVCASDARDMSLIVPLVSTLHPSRRREPSTRA